jgi:hypothetical protein
MQSQLNWSSAINIMFLTNKRNILGKYEIRQLQQHTYIHLYIYIYIYIYIYGFVVSAFGIGDRFKNDRKFTAIVVGHCVS